MWPVLNVVQRLDTWFNAKVALVSDPLVIKVMLFIAAITATDYGLIVSALVILILLYKKRRDYAILLTVAMTGGWVIEFLLKILFHRARPENALIHLSGYSFPSGHAIMSTIFFLCIIYFIKGNKQGLFNYALIVSTLMILLVGFSRLFLNVHWFSDVIAGFLLGSVWFLLVVRYKKYLMF